MSDPKNVRPSPRWLIWAVAVVFLAMLGVLTLVAFSLQGAEHDQFMVAQQRHATIVQLSKNNDALRTQIEKLGQKPVAPSAASVIAGINGENGLNGSNGVNGRDGRGVVSFTCQADGSWLILFDDATTQTVGGPCVGATGGTGATGADSTIPGPAGANGADGAPGADGQPPLSWTFPYTDELGKTTTYTCTRSDPFDPSAPTYTCSAN